jgi:lysophospholipase L1-like esterase
VYGSSLTRDLKSDLLSKRGKTFKVFTKGGAHVDTVIKMVKSSLENKEVCPACVESIFLVVGGNDVQNIKSEPGLEKLTDTYNKLFNFIDSKFPAVRINVMSLIPRRCYDYSHVQRIFYINNFLKDVCSKDNSNLFFIPMFTKFLIYKYLYHSSGHVYLNKKLYLKDDLHFSATGTCVLAKTLIAVANNPRY